MSKRIFISFAVEDSNLRDFLVGQARNENSPFEFVDMSVKQPWDSEWKTKCRTKIKGCDGMIAIVTRNTKSASGQLWEVNCAKEEHISCVGIWGHDDDKNFGLPSELNNISVMAWTWNNIKKWLDRL